MNVNSISKKKWNRIKFKKKNSNNILFNSKDVSINFCISNIDIDFIKNMEHQIEPNIIE